MFRFFFCCGCCISTNRNHMHTDSITYLVDVRPELTFFSVEPSAFILPTSVLLVYPSTAPSSISCSASSSETTSLIIFFSRNTVLEPIFLFQVETMKTNLLHGNHPWTFGCRRRQDLHTVLGQVRFFSQFFKHSVQITFLPRPGCIWIYRATTLDGQIVTRFACGGTAFFHILWESNSKQTKKKLTS